MRCFLMQKLFNPRIAKFLKRTMCLTLAAFVLIPAVAYSIPNGFTSAKAASSYEPVGVGKKLVDCFPGEDRLFAKYVYEKVLGKSDWDSKCGEYQLADNDVQAIQNCTKIDMTQSVFAKDKQKCSDVTGIQNFTNLTYLDLSHNKITFLPELPAGLTFLNVRYNQLTSLPELPAGLTTLCARHNKLTSVPELPAGLLRLNLGENQLKSLPKLPEGLIYLNIKDNYLDSFPEFPAGLDILDISGNPAPRPQLLPIGLTVYQF